MTKNLDFSKQEMYEKLLNLLMKNGKKNTVRKIVNKALKKASLKLPVKDIYAILYTAICNLSPDIELKSKDVNEFVNVVDVKQCVFLNKLKIYQVNDIYIYIYIYILYQYIMYICS